MLAQKKNHVHLEHVLYCEVLFRSLCSTAKRALFVGQRAAGQPYFSGTADIDIST